MPARTSVWPRAMEAGELLLPSFASSLKVRCRLRLPSVIYLVPRVITHAIFRGSGLEMMQMYYVRDVCECHRWRIYSEAGMSRGQETFRRTPHSYLNMTSNSWWRRGSPQQSHPLPLSVFQASSFGPSTVAATRYTRYISPSHKVLGRSLTDRQFAHSTSE